MYNPVVTRVGKVRQRCTILGDPSHETSSWHAVNAMRENTPARNATRDGDMTVSIIMYCARVQQSP